MLELFGVVLVWFALGFAGWLCWSSQAAVHSWRSEARCIALSGLWKQMVTVWQRPVRQIRALLGMFWRQRAFWPVSSSYGVYIEYLFSYSLFGYSS